MLFGVMFCRMCGKQLDEDVKFCPDCGADLGDAPALDFTLNTQSELPAKKKSKKIWAILIPVIAVVVAAAVAMAMFLPGVLAAKADPQTMLEKALAGLDGRAGTVVAENLAYYGQLSVATEQAASGSLDIEVSQTLLDLLAMAGGEDFSWLQNISLDYIAAFDGDKAQADISLNLGEFYILGMEVAYDMQQNLMWVGLPDLHDQILCGPISEGDLNLQVETPAYDALFALLYEERDVLAEVAQKYTAASCDMIKAQSKEQTKIAIGEKSYEVTMLNCYVDNESIYEPAMEFCKWLSNFDSFYRMLDRLSDIYGEEDLAELMRGNIADFMDGMDSAKDEQLRIDLCMYLNAAGEFIGINYEDAGFECISIKDGSKTVGRMVAGGVGLFYDLTDNNGAVSGDVAFKTESGESLSLTLEDFTIGHSSCSGALSVEVPKELISQLIGDVGFSPKTVLRLSMNSTQKTSDVKLELIMADMPMLTISTTAKMLDAYGVNLPEGGINIEDETAIEAWLLELDYTQLVGNILEAGVPESIVMAMFYGAVDQ